MRLAIVASHPIQYQAPLFRKLSNALALTVFFCHRATEEDQSRAGFGVGFDWDVDLLAGYEHMFLSNVSKCPGVDRFAGCDTPAIGARLNADRFDAVLIMGWHLKSFLQALYAAKRRGLPVLVRGDSHLETPRGLFKRAAKEFAYPVFLRSFDAALYVGQRSFAYWRHYRYPSERLFFSPHCVDSEWFASRATPEARAAFRSRLDISSTAKVVLFAGKLVEFKRPGDIIAAAARIQSRRLHVEILFAGDGPLRAELAARAGTTAIRCHFAGFCNQAVMPAAYSASDALVLPSDGRETWGLVANEAIACGLPVILSDAVGSAPDLAGDGTAGRIFPMGDVAGLALAIEDILLRPPARQSLAAKAAQYSLEAAADGVIRGLARLRLKSGAPGLAEAA